jgi:hypothetical protein
MSFGIGLGSFMDGFSKGTGLRAEMDERAERKEDRQLLRDRNKVEQAQADELFAEKRDDRAYARDRTVLTDNRADAAYNRAEAGRVATEKLNADTVAAFDEGVKAGTVPPDSFSEFWKKNALPMRVQQLLLDGDVAGADAYRKWGESEDAIAGGKLFSSALLKAQTGDPGGALDDAIKAGQLGGYMAGGYEVAGQQEMRDPQGNLLGYRVSITGPDGKTSDQDIPVDQVPQVISTFLNPDAAWASQQQAQAKASETAAKTAEELSTYEEKKRIDQKYDKGGGNKGRGDAIKVLRDRMDGLDGGPAFDDLKPAEQEAAIAKELALQGGDSSAMPAPRPVVVDTQTGQPVRPGASAAPKSDRGGPAPAAPVAPTPSSNSVPRGTQATDGLGLAPSPDRLAPNAEAAPAAALGDKQLEAIDKARAIAALGQTGQAAKVLTDAGVPEEAWPKALLATDQGIGQAFEGIGGITGSTAQPDLTALSPEQRKSYDAARAQYLSFGNARRARVLLEDAGVPPELWPDGLAGK